MRRTTKTWRTSISVAIVLLCCAAYDRRSAPKPADAAPYMARVREAAALPNRVGVWTGTDVPIPPAAVALLRPNVLFSRDYVDLQSGARATFLLVQCGDARDLIGHYPPICYVSSGWTLQGSTPRSWQAGSWLIDGMEYVFANQPVMGRGEMVVMNTMLLPLDGFKPDMSSVRSAAANLQGRAWGAAQIQVLLRESVPPERREAIFESLVEAHEPLIQTILDARSEEPVTEPAVKGVADPAR